MMFKWKKTLVVSWKEFRYSCVPCLMGQVACVEAELRTCWEHCSIWFIFLFSYPSLPPLPLSHARTLSPLTSNSWSRSAYERDLFLHLGSSCYYTYFILVVQLGIGKGRISTGPINVEILILSWCKTPDSSRRTVNITSCQKLKPQLLAEEKVK